MAHKIRIFHALQRAHSALFRAADAQLKTQAGVTAAQQGLLFALLQNDGSPITEIARLLNMGNSSVTGLVSRMEPRGLLRRETSRNDARVQQVFIEEAGRALCERAMPAVHRINAELLAPFSADEQKTIERFLNHISDNAAAIVSGRPIELSHRKAIS